MDAREEAEFRLRLAKEHFEDAEQEYRIGLWAKCVMSAQISIENAAKSVIACFFPVPKVHDLSVGLLQIEIKKEFEEKMKRLSQIVERFGTKEHVLTTYGDEIVYATPRQIYDEGKAASALKLAKEAQEIACFILKEYMGNGC